MNKIILVGGMPRSGTTLLSRVIGEHFQIPFSPETHFFSVAFKNGKIELERLSKEVMADRRIEGAYRKIIDKQRNMDTFRELLREIIGDAPIVGEKTPAHLLWFPEILKTDRQVTAIAIVRDFFEIIESLRKVAWNNASFYANLKRCIRYHKITYRTQRQYPDRLIVVDYLTLCKDEMKTIAALSERLPRGDYDHPQQAFDPDFEPWKSNALSAPQVIHRKVPLARLHLWLMANCAHVTCNIIWPLKTVHEK